MAHEWLKIGKYSSRAEASWVPMLWASDMGSQNHLHGLTQCRTTKIFESQVPSCPSVTSTKLQEPLSFLTTVESLNPNRLDNRRFLL